MFDRILVPVDLTAKNYSALDRALSVAASNAEIALLHVIETIDDDTGELEPFYRRLEAAAQTGLARLAARVTEYGYAPRLEIVYGRRVDQIVAFAERQGCDLIVLGSHRLEGIQPGRDWLSISYRVALLAPCAVLLVK